MEKRLYEASLGGDVTSLMELVEEDQLILDRVITSFSETPLHIAAMYGHVNFTRKILSLKPELASELDSQGFSPLHLASARKNLDLVKVLLESNPDVCSVTDQDGRTPLHLAAMKGRVEIAKVLIQTHPKVIQVLLDRKETILHLCVKHNRLEALKLLVESLGNTTNAAAEESVNVNSMDDDGNTILHVAVAKKLIEMIKYLVVNDILGVEVNALNKNGFTALDVLAQSARDLKDIEIGELLRDAGVYKACNRDQVAAAAEASERLVIRKQPPWGWRWMSSSTSNAKKNDQVVRHDHEHYNQWLTRNQNALMVVASLIATMAFQAGLTPPGGFWQDDYLSKGGLDPILPHKAGKSVLADNDPEAYNLYMSMNTIGFLASLSIILLLVSGLPLKRRFFVGILMAIMWVAITSMAVTYLLSLKSTLPYFYRLTAFKILIILWSVFMSLVVLLHFLRFLSWLLGKLGIFKKKGSLLEYEKIHRIVTQI